MESYNLSSRKMFKNVKRKMFVQKLFKQKKTQTLQNVYKNEKNLQTCQCKLFNDAI